MNVSPADIKDPTLRYSIIVDGAALQDQFPIESAEVLHEVNKISNAEFTILFDEQEENGIAPDDEGKMSPGKSVEIKAGYGTEQEKTIFKGVIAKQRTQVKSAGTYSMVISCKHQAVQMVYDKEEEEFRGKTDSEIIKAVFQKWSLDADIDSTSTVIESMTKQKGSSDWDFILTRAEFNGYVVTLDGEKVSVKKPDISNSPVLRIAFGESIITFNADINTENQLSAVEASTWDVKKQQLINAKSTEPSLADPLKKAISMAKISSRETLKLSSNTNMTQDDLKTWADGKLLRMRLSVFRGQASFIGNGVIKTGDNIELANIGKNYNGNVWVSSVKHSFVDGQWTTTLKFGLEDSSVSEKPGFVPTPAAGQVPPVHDLQVATVQKINDDPASEFRIQIKLPQAKSDEGIWARMSQFYGSAGNGVAFFPEVNDEVVVGFFESDPRSPVVLGSLYSNTRAPADQPKENNYIKSITTKSKLKLSFDDEKKIIVLLTPGGNSITISDDAKSIEIKDQNSNVVKMSSDGISLQSNKDIKLSATGNISLDAKGKVSISAAQDIACDGTNINHSAKAGFTAKGNATAELSASGQTTVKGGLVMIN